MEASLLRDLLIFFARSDPFIFSLNFKGLNIYLRDLNNNMRVKVKYNGFGEVSPELSLIGNE